MHAILQTAVYSQNHSVSNCFRASAITFCKYNSSSTRPNFLGSFRNTILKSSTLSLCRGAAIFAASRHYTLIPLRPRFGRNTISFRYSVTMSSRTATDSGDGFGSSPKAYIRSFTSVRKIFCIAVQSFWKRFCFRAFRRGL